MSAPRLRTRRVQGGFVVERPGLYVFDTDLEQAREWAEALERAAAQHRLGGFVDSSAEKTAARKIARAVKGVKGVKEVYDNLGLKQ